MRIAFNGQRLAGQPFGVGRYLEYLLRYWKDQLADGEEITVFVRRPPPKWLDELGPRIRTVLLESRLSGIPWENLHLGPAAADYDVLFCPAYSAPISYRAPLVVANHSVNETEPAAHSWLYRQTYARLFRYNARQADAVIVPGERTRKAVEEHYGVPVERLHVVPQGADDAFHPISDQTLLSSTRKRFFGSNRPYLLFVGKGSPRRNIPMLVEAFARLRQEGRWPHGLLLFGPYLGDIPLDKLIVELGLENDVVQTDGVVDRHSDLAPIYAAADIFIHPSENEGWSMTTVEALASGTAVIAANRGGLGEIAAGHAYMIDNPSVETLHDAIHTVLSDDALRADLQQKARERGASLRWDKIAKQTLEVIREVGSKR